MKETTNTKGEKHQVLRGVAVYSEDGTPLNADDTPLNAEELKNQPMLLYNPL